MNHENKKKQRTVDTPGQDDLRDMNMYYNKK